MKILGETEKNPDTGENEIMIKLSFADIDYLNGALRFALERNFGDKDDVEYKKLSQHLKDTLLEVRGKLKPS